jgi:hypothetical protein
MLISSRNSGLSDRISRIAVTRFRDSSFRRGDPSHVRSLEAPTDGCGSPWPQPLFAFSEALKMIARPQLITALQHTGTGTVTGDKRCVHHPHHDISPPRHTLTPGVRTSAVGDGSIIWTYAPLAKTVRQYPSDTDREGGQPFAPS